MNGVFSAPLAILAQLELFLNSFEIAMRVVRDALAGAAAQLHKVFRKF